jgi:hypothetical protein
MARLDRRGEGRNFYANLMGMPGDYQALDASRETSQADEDLFAMPEYAIREPQFDMSQFGPEALARAEGVGNLGPGAGNIQSNRAPMTKSPGGFAIGTREDALREKNALNTMFEGAIMGGDLEKANRLAVTPQQRAMLDAAQGQFVNERDARGKQAQYEQRMLEAGKLVEPKPAAGNLLQDYRNLQEFNLRSGEHLEDRALNTKKTNAQINELDAKTAMERLKANAPVGNEAQKAFSVKTAEQTAKAIADARDKLQSSYAGISRIDEMKKALDSGVYSGTLAEGRTGVANFFETIGVAGIDKEKLGNSQEYMKHAKELTLAALKESMGTTQLSNADRDFVSATVPQLDTDPEARIRLLKYMRNKYQSNISNFDAMEKHATQNGGSLTGFKPMELSSMNLGGGNSPVTKLTW